MRVSRANADDVGRVGSAVGSAQAGVGSRESAPKAQVRALAGEGFEVQAKALSVAGQEDAPEAQLGDNDKTLAELLTAAIGNPKAVSKLVAFPEAEVRFAEIRKALRQTAKLDPAQRQSVLQAWFAGSSNAVKTLLVGASWLEGDMVLANEVPAWDFAILKAPADQAALLKAMDGRPPEVIELLVQRISPASLKSKDMLGCAAAARPALIARIESLEKSEKTDPSQMLAKSSDLDQIFDERSIADPKLEAWVDGVVKSQATAVKPSLFVAWYLSRKDKPAGQVDTWDAGRLRWVAGLARVNRDPALIGILDAVVDKVSDVGTLKQLFAARWGMDVFDKVTDGVSKERNGAFDTAGLRRIWKAFATLPEGHVTDTVIASLTRTAMASNATTAGGARNFGTGGEMTISYDASKQDRTLGEGWKVEPAFKDIAELDHVARHEVGHAVGQQLNMNAGMGATERGGWVQNGGVVDALIADLLKEDAQLAEWATKKPDVMTALRTELAKGKPLPKVIQPVLLTAAGLKAGDSLGTVKLGRMLNGLAQGDGHWGSGDNTAAAGHGYAYIPDEGWTQYDANRRKNNSLSAYQYAAPAEWFAELYAFYYDTPEAGTAVKARDPEGKALMDQVHASKMADKKLAPAPKEKK